MLCVQAVIIKDVAVALCYTPLAPGCGPMWKSRRDAKSQAKGRSSLQLTSLNPCWDSTQLKAILQVYTLQSGQSLETTILANLIVH